MTGYPKNPIPDLKVTSFDHVKSTKNSLPSLSKAFLTKLFPLTPPLLCAYQKDHLFQGIFLCKRLKTQGNFRLLRHRSPNLSKNFRVLKRIFPQMKLMFPLHGRLRSYDKKAYGKIRTGTRLPLLKRKNHRETLQFLHKCHGLPLILRNFWRWGLGTPGTAAPSLKNCRAA